MPIFGTLYWNELITIDPDRAMAFYADQIGWTFEASPTDEAGEYRLAKNDGDYVAGIIPLNSPPYDTSADFWLPYLAVENIDESVECAMAAGAEIIRPSWDVPNTGRRAVLREPGGAFIAWMTPLG